MVNKFSLRNLCDVFMSLHIFCLNVFKFDFDLNSNSLSNTMHNNTQPRSGPISLLSLCMEQRLANLPQQSASPPSLRLSYRWSHLSSYPSVPAMSRWRVCSAKISPESTIVWLPHCLQKTSKVQTHDI